MIGLLFNYNSFLEIKTRDELLLTFIVNLMQIVVLFTFLHGSWFPLFIIYAVHWVLQTVGMLYFLRVTLESGRSPMNTKCVLFTLVCGCFFSFLPYIYDKREKMRFVVLKLMGEKTEELLGRNKEMNSLINTFPNPIVIQRQDNILFQNDKMGTLISEINSQVHEGISRDKAFSANFKDFKSECSDLERFINLDDSKEDDKQLFQNPETGVTLECQRKQIDYGSQQGSIIFINDQTEQLECERMRTT